MPEKAKSFCAYCAHFSFTIDSVYSPSSPPYCPGWSRIFHRPYDHADSCMLLLVIYCPNLSDVLTKEIASYDTGYDYGPDSPICVRYEQHDCAARRQSSAR
jgi:hypothetical protein